MRIEELQNNLYIKSADTVEKFLLNIIKEYFKDSNEALEGSREYIIREAVDRMRTEMDYNSLGVLSITLPDGRILKGDVTLSLEDLGGEPLISPKLSAFNVNFGSTAGTACEGNDPRLYDARMPIKHQHSTSDILGLDGIISTIIGQLDRVETQYHVHDNKEVLDLLKYTGDKDEIDLTLLDTLEPRITEITDQIRQSITDYIQNTDLEIDDINAELLVINQRIDDIYNYVNSKCEENLTEAQEYADTLINTAKENILDELDNNYVKKADIQNLIAAVEGCLTLVNTEQWNINSLILTANQETKVATLNLSQATRDELQRRNVNLSTSKDIIFNFYIEYTNNNIVIRQPLPYIQKYNSNYDSYMYPLIPNLSISGYIDNINTTNNALKVCFKTNENQLDSEILNGKLVCDILAKEPVHVYG